MKVSATLGAFLIGAVLLSWILGEAAVRYEMWSTGALARSELRDDSGLGLLGVVVVQPLSVVSAAGVAIVVWWSFTARPLPSSRCSRRGPRSRTENGRRRGARLSGGVRPREGSSDE
jgi:hypothetical protein